MSQQSHISGDNTPNVPPMYCERREWEDVTPIPQYEGVNPIAPIFYTPQYKDATDYFRGVVRTGEMSQRVLELTENIIRMNAAHYSAWQYRYKTLLAIEAPLDIELRLMDALAVQFMKTYQVWHHRRLLLTLLTSKQTTGDIPTSTPPKDPLDIATTELDFIAQVLGEDAKNYHTWSYRQWLLAHIDDAGLWLGELPYVDELLEADVRNNSAWHHRFFVVFSRGARAGATPAEEAEVLQREIRYTKDQIALAPNNPSAWNYLRGILDHTKTSWSPLTKFVVPYTVAKPSTSPDAEPLAAKEEKDESTAEDKEEEVVDLDNPKPPAQADLPCVAALDFLAEIYARDSETQKAVAIWKSLGDVHDKMRKKYWEYRIKEASAIPPA